MRTMILIALALVATGCTMYDVRKPDGTELRIRSMREFPNGINVEYESKEGAKLKVNAGKVQNDTGTTEILAQALQMLLLQQRPAPKE